MPDEFELSLLNYTVELLLICNLVDDVVGYPVGPLDVQHYSVGVCCEGVQAFLESVGEHLAFAAVEEN